MRLWLSALLLWGGASVIAWAQPQQALPGPFVTPVPPSVSETPTPIPSPTPVIAGGCTCTVYVVIETPTPGASPVATIKSRHRYAVRPKCPPDTSSFTPLGGSP